jgi:hypothetical protein
MSFKQYAEMRDLQEGLLQPDRPLLKGMPKSNPMPTTDGHRRRLRLTAARTVKTMQPIKPVKPFQPIKPTVRPVAEIVPQNIIPKLPAAPKR